MESSSPVICRVISYENLTAHGKEGLDKHVFTIDISIDGDSYIVKRTAGHLKDLHQKLQKRFPKSQLPMFPITDILSSKLSSAFDKSFANACPGTSLHHLIHM
jgi:hypothetical protein